MGFEADPDGDGIGNVFELWLGLDPATADASSIQMTVFATIVNGERFITTEVTVSSTMDNLLAVEANISSELVEFRNGTRTTLSDDGSTRVLRFCDTVPTTLHRGFARLTARADSPL